MVALATQQEIPIAAAVLEYPDIEGFLMFDTDKSGQINWLGAEAVAARWFQGPDSILVPSSQRSKNKLWHDVSRAVRRILGHPLLNPYIEKKKSQPERTKITLNEFSALSIQEDDWPGETPFIWIGCWIITESWNQKPSSRRIIANWNRWNEQCSTQRQYPRASGVISPAFRPTHRLM